jgi:hypothetical protein
LEGQVRRWCRQREEVKDGSVGWLLPLPCSVSRERGRTERERAERERDGEEKSNFKFSFFNN